MEAAQQKNVASMGKKIFMVLLAIIVAFIAVVTVINLLTSHDEVVIMNAKNHVAANLKDPSSATFQDIFIVKEPTDTNGSERGTVCGQVNGRNSFGAYSGYTRFVARYFSNRKMDVLDISSVAIESTDRSTSDIALPLGQRQTVFEKVYWNESCIDAHRPKTFSGE